MANNTNQNTDIDRQLRDILRPMRGLPSYHQTIDAVTAIITKAVADARIDELNIMVKAEEHLDDFSTPEHPYTFNAQAHRDNRIQALKRKERNG